MNSKINKLSIMKKNKMKKINFRMDIDNTANKNKNRLY